MDRPEPRVGSVRERLEARQAVDERLAVADEAQAPVALELGRPARRRPARQHHEVRLERAAVAKLNLHATLAFAKSSPLGSIERRDVPD